MCGIQTEKGIQRLKELFQECNPIYKNMLKFDDNGINNFKKQIEPQDPYYIEQLMKEYVYIKDTITDTNILSQESWISMWSRIVVTKPEMVQHMFHIQDRPKIIINKKKLPYEQQINLYNQDTCVKKDITKNNSTLRYPQLWRNDIETFIEQYPIYQSNNKLHRIGQIFSSSSNKTSDIQKKISKSYNVGYYKHQTPIIVLDDGKQVELSSNDNNNEISTTIYNDSGILLTLREISNNNIDECIKIQKALSVPDISSKGINNKSYISNIQSSSKTYNPNTIDIQNMVHFCIILYDEDDTESKKWYKNFYENIPKNVNIKLYNVCKNLYKTKKCIQQDKELYDISKQQYTINIDNENTQHKFVEHIYAQEMHSIQDMTIVKKSISYIQSIPIYKVLKLAGVVSFVVAFTFLNPLTDLHASNIQYQSKKKFS